jgi:ankyrin repeat protein
VGDVDQLRRVLTMDNVDDVDGVNWTALVRSATNGQVECVKVCLEMGANVNVCDRGGATPLHYASSNGHVGIVQILLDAGATVDVYTRSNGGWTPLYFAIHYNRVDIARLLIDRGASVSIVLGNGLPAAIPDWVNTFDIAIELPMCRRYHHWDPQVPSNAHDWQQRYQCVETDWKTHLVE